MSASSPHAPIDNPAPPQMTMRQVLGISSMRRIWYAQIISVLGDFLALYAVLGVMGFKMHATAVQLTWVQISYMAPIALLGLIAGVFVDRWPVKPTLVASDLTRALLCLGLLLATQPWHFYIVLAAISVVSSFFAPAQGVSIRIMVPLHGLRAANTLMQQVMFLMRIAGPSLAALIVAQFGPQSCYIADAATFVASACFILSASVMQPERKDAQESSKVGLARVSHDMREGLSFIVHHAGLLFVILALAAGMFTLGCFGPLIAVYVRESLHESTRTFGFVSSTIGLGILLGMNGLQALGGRLGNRTMVYLGLGGIVGGLVVLAGLTYLPTAFFGAFMIGASVAAILIPAQTLIQQETPAAMMGRVGSTVMSTVFTAQVAGLLLSGVLARAAGVRMTFALSAGLLIILMLTGRLASQSWDPHTARM
jgi:MFS family permease